jgi:glycosyltransferase involved in cell wall biosynthesis
VHLGLLIYGDLEAVSGGYLYDRKLVEHLRKDGHQVELISLDWRSYPRHLFDNFSGALFHRLNNFEGELLLQDELNHPSLFLLNRRLRAAAKFPIYSIVHHLRCSEPRPIWQNRYFQFVERLYLETIDGFIINSRTTFQSICRLGIDLGHLPNLIAVPAGDQFIQRISDSLIVERTHRPGPLRMIFLGNLIPRKGLHVLLDALAQLSDRNLTLTIAGNPTVDQDYVRRIKRQIVDQKLGDRVYLLGSLTTEKLTEVLCDHQVMAVPSFYEGYGIVYLEGMAFGLPAIATNSGAASEIITDSQDGFLVPPGDPSTLADRINRLAIDRRLLAEMGQAARNRFLSQPTWEQTTGSIIKFLSE